MCVAEALVAPRVCQRGAASLWSVRVKGRNLGQRAGGPSSEALLLLTAWTLPRGPLFHLPSALQFLPRAWGGVGVPCPWLVAELGSGTGGLESDTLTSRAIPILFPIPRL